MKVRSFAHALGCRCRYRVKRKDLPGKPDLVFPKLRKIILVHGCFFHMHDCRYGRVVPKTNEEIWRRKREGNRERDARVIHQLKELGWDTLVVWECSTKNTSDIEDEIRSFLG